MNPVHPNVVQISISFGLLDGLFVQVHGSDFGSTTGDLGT